MFVCRQYHHGVLCAARCVRQQTDIAVCGGTAATIRSSSPLFAFLPATPWGERHPHCIPFKQLRPSISIYWRQPKVVKQPVPPPPAPLMVPPSLSSFSIPSFNHILRSCSSWPPTARSIACCMLSSPSIPGSSRSSETISISPLVQSVARSVFPRHPAISPPSWQVSKYMIYVPGYPCSDFVYSSLPAVAGLPAQLSSLDSFPPISPISPSVLSITLSSTRVNSDCMFPNKA